MAEIKIACNIIGQTSIIHFLRRNINITTIILERHDVGCCQYRIKTNEGIYLGNGIYC